MKKIAFSSYRYAFLCSFSKLILPLRASLPTLFVILFFVVSDSRAQTTIDLSRPVGMTEGVAGNNGAGAATYTIPIDLPAGIGGYKPPVNLSYSSQGNGNDFCGQGWTLIPISTITRSGKNAFQDGINTPVNYTATNDAFVLDGQRLMLQSGTAGAHGATYGMENETFSLITANGGDGNSPENFYIKQKDGTELDYGWQWTYMRTSSSGAEKMFWLLSAIRDAYGNEKARYFYTIDETSRTFSLSRITYSNYMVDFIYDTKTDWTSAETYLSGVALNSKYILNRIEIKKIDETPIRSYSFSYQYRHKKYFLTSVTEAGADGTTLNPITFTYGENPSAPDVSVTGAYSGFTKETYAGDYDGDGIQDIQAFSYITDNTTQEKWFTRYDIVGDFSSYGGSPAISFKHQYDIVADLGGERSYYRLIGTSAAQNPFATSDYDGDGKDDILLAKFNYVYTFRGININYSRKYNSFSGLGHKKMEYDYIPTSSGGAWHNYIKNGGSFFTSGDFDGDGYVDYILILSNNTGNNFKAFLSTPAKNVFNQEIANFGVGVNGATGGYAAYTVAESKAIIPINFDGDGKTDLLVVRDEGSYVLSVNGNSTTTYSSQVLHSTTSIQTGYKLFVGDFNGDNNTDLLVRSSADNPSASWNILYSTGLAFNSTPFTPSRTIYLEKDGFSLFHNLTVADYDNDGKTDIWHSVQEDAVNTTHYLYYSNGISFAVEGYSDANPTNTEITNTTLDVDGDGKTDLISMRAVGSSYSGRFIRPKPFKEQNLLVAADNLGYRTSFGYSLLNGRYTTHGSVYSRSVWNEYDVDDFSSTSPNIRNYMVPKAPIYALASIDRPNGIGSHFNEQYQYQDMIIHRQGRGWLGFRRMRVDNNPMNIYDSIINDVDLTYSILYPVQQKQYSSIAYPASQISQSTSTNSFQSLSGGRFFIKKDRAHTKNYLTNAATDHANTYDSYGNITQTVVQTGVSDGINIVGLIESATTSVTYGTYGGAPYPGFATSVSVSKTRNGQPTVNKARSYTYTAQGLPETISDFVGTPIAQTSTNVYNGLGLLIQSSLSAPGVTTPVTEYVYDGTGNYLLEKKLIGDGITRKTSYTYDTRWGAPLTETGSDGLTTSYIYNTFGELTQTNLPDGTAVSTTKSWETSGNARISSLVQRTDGSVPEKVYTDILGREVKTEKRGFNNQWITASKIYNNRGQLESETAPYYSWEPVKTTSYTYDNYGRPQTATNTTGTITTSYYNGGGEYEVTTTNAISQNASKRYDVSGKVIASSDNGIMMTFTYNSWGNQLTAWNSGLDFISNTYDSYGRKVSTFDINVGTYTYQYNSIGQLTQQTDASSNVQTMTYDVFGRTATTAGSQGTTTYSYYYDPVSGKSNDNTTQVIGFNGDVTTFAYDALHRLNVETITASGSSLSKTYTYDGKGRHATTSYPAGFLIRNVYDENDIIIQKKYEQGATVKTLFTADSVSSRGFYNAYTKGNGKAGHIDWDYTKEMATRYHTAGIQDLNLVYQANTGNLLSRNDALKGLTETFTYNTDDKLISATVNGVQQFNITYHSDGGGRILQKTGVGNYDYDLYKGYILRSLSPIASEPDPDLTMGPQTYTVSSTALQRPQTVTHNNGYQVEYSYGFDNQRLTSVLKNGGTTIATKSYWGNMEGLTKGGVSYEIYYINAGNGLNNIIVKQGGSVNIYYAYTDQLNSIVALTDEAGVLVAEQNFDSWGRKRNPANWTYASIPSVPDWLYRGYTGHEQVDELGIINMNARMYDPTTGQMLAPDNYISSPLSFSGYNRFTYANGNPLKYTDPTGMVPVIMGVGDPITLPPVTVPPAGPRPVPPTYIPTSPFGYPIIAIPYNGGDWGPGAYGGGNPDPVYKTMATVTVKAVIKRPWYKDIADAINGFNAMSKHVKVPGQVEFSEVLNEMDKLNPLSNFANGIKIHVTGSDFQNNKQNHAEGASRILLSIPFMRIGKGIVVLEEVTVNGIRSIAQNRAAGLAMENALDITGTKMAIKVGGRIRFPDRVSKEVIEEAKNVRKLYLTSQIKDYLKYAGDNNLQFILHTRESTIFSKPLQQLIDEGTIIHNIVPGF